LEGAAAEEANEAVEAAELLRHEGEEPAPARPGEVARLRGGDDSAATLALGLRVRLLPPRGVLRGVGTW